MSNQAPGNPAAPRPWYKSTPALVLWVIIGWSWLWGWLPYGALDRLNLHYEQAKRRRAEGASFGLLSDAHIALAKELDTPARLGELSGGSALPADATCTLVWTDEARTFSSATRAWDATPAVGYMAVTRAGKTTVGRYAMKLWTDFCRSEWDSSDSTYGIECTKIGKLRLVERLAEPASGPMPSVVPGACVLGAVPSAGPVRDRYAIQLPAGKTVTVRLYTIPADLALRGRLFLGDKEIPASSGHADTFVVPSMADYELQLDRAPGFPADATGRYSLQVHWGKAVGLRCPIPELDHRDCYGPHPETPR